MLISQKKKPSAFKDIHFDGRVGLALNTSSKIVRGFRRCSFPGFRENRDRNGLGTGSKTIWFIDFLGRRWSRRWIRRWRSSTLLHSDFGIEQNTDALKSERFLKRVPIIAPQKIHHLRSVLREVPRLYLVLASLKHCPCNSTFENRRSYFWDLRVSWEKEPNKKTASALQRMGDIGSVPKKSSKSTVARVKRRDTEQRSNISICHQIITE